MISLYAAMLMALGFLVAALLAVIVLPAYRRRIERFSLERLRRELPLTEAEIRADKDRLRAEFALEVHSLESRLHEATEGAARQSIEINRRDAKVSALEQAIEGQQLVVDEHENARRVLEQAILDRLPKVEQRLAESRKILAQRDAEIALLSETSAKQTAALEEATQINIQQREELERLRTTLDTRLARNRETLGDPRFDGEVALKSDIEMLRAKTRDQAAMISKLQARIAKGDARAAGDREREVSNLRIEIRKLEADLAAVNSVNNDDMTESKMTAARIRTLEKNEKAQSEEIARLRAELATHSGGNIGAKAQSELALKAERDGLKKNIEEQSLAVQSLRAELASAQEKLARQAEHFSEELRRLSSRAIATATEELRAEAGRRASLVERLASPRPPKLSAVSSDASPTPQANAVPATGNGNRDGNSEDDRAPVSDVAANQHAVETADKALSATSTDVVSPRRPRLLERISNLDKRG